MKEMLIASRTAFELWLSELWSIIKPKGYEEQNFFEASCEPPAPASFSEDFFSEYIKQVEGYIDQNNLDARLYDGSELDDADYSDDGDYESDRVVYMVNEETRHIIPVSYTHLTLPTICSV